MALVTEYICTKCGRTVHEIVRSDRVCLDCSTEIARAKKAAHRAYISELSIEKRLRLIEDQLYDLDVDRRLKALEAHHVRY